MIPRYLAARLACWMLYRLARGFIALGNNDMADVLRSAGVAARRGELPELARTVRRLGRERSSHAAAMARIAAEQIP